MHYRNYCNSLSGTEESPPQNIDINLCPHIRTVIFWIRTILAKERISDENLTDRMVSAICTPIHKIQALCNMKWRTSSKDTFVQTNYPSEVWTTLLLSCQNIYRLLWQHLDVLHTRNMWLGGIVNLRKHSHKELCLQLVVPKIYRYWVYTLPVSWFPVAPLSEARMRGRFLSQRAENTRCPLYTFYAADEGLGADVGGHSAVDYNSTTAPS